MASSQKVSEDGDLSDEKRKKYQQIIDTFETSVMKLTYFCKQLQEQYEAQQQLCSRNNDVIRILSKVRDQELPLFSINIAPTKQSPLAEKVNDLDLVCLTEDDFIAKAQLWLEIFKELFNCLSLCISHVSFELKGESNIAKVRHCAAQVRENTTTGSVEIFSRSYIMADKEKNVTSPDPYFFYYHGELPEQPDFEVAYSKTYDPRVPSIYKGFLAKGIFGKFHYFPI